MLWVLYIPSKLTYFGITNKTLKIGLWHVSEDFFVVFIAFPEFGKVWE